MNDSYTLKETVEKRFDDIEEEIKKNHDGFFEYLRRIEKQTTETNGRVGSLEMTRIQMWTAIAIILFLGGTIITLSIMAINTKIKAGVDQAFEERFDKVEIVPK